MKVATIDGKFRRVISAVPHGPGTVLATVVTGSRQQRATSSRSPGSGWQPMIGYANRWERYNDTVEDCILAESAVMDVEDWPEGFIPHGADLHALVDMLKPHMKKAVDAIGANARKARPNMQIGTIEMALKRDGLPMPTEEEFDAALTDAWEAVKPRRRNAGQRKDVREIIVQSATIVDTLPKPEPEPELVTSGLPDPDGTVLSDEKGDIAIAADLPGAEPEKKPEPTEDDKLSAKAFANGWTGEFLDGASKRKKGDAGYTLAYMAKNEFDPDKHGK